MYFPALLTRFKFSALCIGIKYTALVANCLFSRAFHRYQVYRACRQLLVFPRFSSVSSIPRLSPTTCFPALFISIRYTAPVANCLFSRAFHQYQVYRACRQLLVFLRFSLVSSISHFSAATHFPALLGHWCHFSTVWLLFVTLHNFSI